MVTNKDFVDKYLQCGLKLIPVYAQSKKPMIANWNKDWDEIKFLNFFNKHPGCNLGVLLGDIIDVEGDSVPANDLLNSLIKDYPHPKYQSSKSLHHLFLNPDPDLTIFTYYSHKKSPIRDLEFRAKSHMSVIPPSIHETGIQYQWAEGSSWPIPEMPDELKNFYFHSKNKIFKTPISKKETLKFSPNHTSSIPIYEQYTCRWFNLNYDVKPGHKKIICPVCKNICFLHKKRLKLERKIFDNHNMEWSCRDCREIDTRSSCRIFRKLLRKNTSPLDFINSQ